MKFAIAVIILGCTGTTTTGMYPPAFSFAKATAGDLQEEGGQHVVVNIEGFVSKKRRNKKRRKFTSKSAKSGLETKQSQRTKEPKQANKRNKKETKNSSPSLIPSNSPSQSQEPSLLPSDVPSLSTNPSAAPSDLPSVSLSPSSPPSNVPSMSADPSGFPSDVPSLSTNPSAAPSDLPSVSLSPSSSPSSMPTIHIYKWGKIGDDIIGELPGNEEFGYSISLSKNGLVLAVGGPGYHRNGDGWGHGHVRVFGLSGEKWFQRGDDFYGAAAVDRLGYSVALSGDGSVVSMGAPSNDQSYEMAGHVRVYKWSKDGVSSDEAWTQRGRNINGEAVSDWSGSSVTMNDDGTFLAIGAPGLERSSGGHVRVFEFGAADESWEKIGQDIDGQNAGNHFSINLASSGSTIAIGAVDNETRNDNSGHVRVFDLVESIWVQRGVAINGKSAGDYSGYSVSLNDAGTVVAIGAPYASNFAGEATVYEWDNEEQEWIQRGDTLHFIGEELLLRFNLFGESISLNGSGDTVVIGAVVGGETNRAGSVYIYEWDGMKWNLTGEIQGKHYYEEFGRSVSISADALTLAAGAPGNSQGRGDGVDYAGFVRVYKWS